MFCLLLFIKVRHISHLDPVLNYIKGVLMNDFGCFVISDISQSMLETVIPKSDSAYVCIVSGKYRGQVIYI